MRTYYCKRCQANKAPKLDARGRDKVTRFRSGFVARYLECNHTVSVNDRAATLDTDCGGLSAQLVGMA